MMNENAFSEEFGSPVQEKKRRERIKRAMTLNLAVIAVCAAILVSFAIPRFENVNAKISETNSLIVQVNGLKDQGINIDDFTAEAAKAGGKNVKSPLLSDKEKISAVMRKDPKYSGTYYEWLNEEVGKDAQSRYDEAIVQKREIIGNIIPTFAESIAGDNIGFDRDRITVASFVRYIEENLFKAFDVQTFGELGIDKVQFDNSKNSVVNIGTFTVDFTIEGKNGQILKLIDYLQNSGKLKIEGGRLISPYPVSRNKKDPTLSDLNNLLITIDKLEAEKSMFNETDSNNVKFSLSFYVKGRTYSSLIEIRSLVVQKIKKLKDDIGSLSKKCATGNSELCSSDVGITAVSAVKSMVPEIDSIDKRMQEIVKNAQVNDLGAEFDKIFSIYASVRAIEANYVKQKAILDRVIQKSKGAPAKKADPKASDQSEGSSAGTGNASP